MKIYRKPHAPGGTLAMLFTCCLYLPSASAGVLSGNEWEVTRGDTLYAIGRAIYPEDAPKQARLRRDIMKLNPSVFDNGANKMSVGVVLKLPDYVVTESVVTESVVTESVVTESVAPKSTSSTVGGPAPAPKPDKVTSRPDLPSASAKEFGGTVWKVKRGDTLYAICRAIYPDDAREQARLGRDIKKLNPSIFADGANNMNVGVVLKLPDYVVTESVTPKSIPPEAVEPAPVPDEVIPEPEPVSVKNEVIPKPAPLPVTPAPVVVPQPEMPTVKEQSAFSTRAKGGAVVSLGYSYGGDKLADVAGGPDISAGTGVQLRLGYEQMFQQSSGYRISLGLQYYTLIKQREVSFRDTYLQLAYQYRVNPIVYGIGVVVDTGAKFESNNSTDYDAAMGAVVYLENVGSGKLAGWGLSVTSLDIKEKNLGTSFDASRAELYYNWRF